MPVTPNFIDRMVLLKLNQGPGPMLDMLGAWSFKAVSVAVKFDILRA